MIKELEQNGWKLARINGSHHHLRHPNSQVQLPPLIKA
ncbi:MAG: type II toxin-antitoxin system HicA family toxin [Halomonas sp.]|nr:type II toxin-antitoxin system HicA family toxin [Halomonas sp.]